MAKKIPPSIRPRAGKVVSPRTERKIGRAQPFYVKGIFSVFHGTTRISKLPINGKWGPFDTEKDALAYIEDMRNSKPGTSVRTVKVIGT